MTQFQVSNPPQSVSRGSESAFADRAARSFCVPKADIAEQGYDLSINRYKEVVYEEVEHRPPHEILDELEGIENEIMQGMAELRRMLS